MGFRIVCLKYMMLLPALVLAVVLLLVVIANILITSSTQKYLYSDLQATPYNKVGILLGTSRYSRSGGLNDHYRLRVNAAYDLFQAGRIDFILVSGDNSMPYYDEPTTIRNDLLKMGIPSNKIYRDNEGFRTLDSIIRAKSVFGLERFTIISQGYLNNRALYIALYNNIDAIAFNAGTGVNSDLSNRSREILARVLAIIELHFLGVGSVDLNNAVTIGVTPPI